MTAGQTRIGVLNDHHLAEVPALFAALGQLTASEFHEIPGRDARRRSVNLIDLHLKS